MVCHFLGKNQIEGKELQVVAKEELTNGGTIAEGAERKFSHTQDNRETVLRGEGGGLEYPIKDIPQ